MCWQQGFRKGGKAAVAVTVPNVRDGSLIWRMSLGVECLVDGLSDRGGEGPQRTRPLRTRSSHSRSLGGTKGGGAEGDGRGRGSSEITAVVSRWDVYRQGRQWWEVCCMYF